MYSPKLIHNLQETYAHLEQAGLLKIEHILSSPQNAHVVIDGRDCIMFASNNYLGFAGDQDFVETQATALTTYGLGTASARFLSGTTALHQNLEKKLAEFLGTEDVILYSTAFMANLGFFASLVNEPLEEGYVDIIYSDEYNHASLIDALKLCKKENLVKQVYRHGDMEHLTELLKADTSKNTRHKIIVSDGVFSMEGYTADIATLDALATAHNALLYIDDAHGVGVLGEQGRGTHSMQGYWGKVDVLSGTLGKALSGTLGGYVAGKKVLIDFLRQKSRTYIFSNSLPPIIVQSVISVLEELTTSSTRQGRLLENTHYARAQLAEHGFTILDGDHPIIPIMIGDARTAHTVAQKLFEKGIYVVALGFPVVPEGMARLRIQITATHSSSDIDTLITALEDIKKNTPF